MNKQIDVMSEHIQNAVDGCASYWSGLIAEALYNAGYRKQKEGEWIYKRVAYADYHPRLFCSCCDGSAPWRSDYCPKCGAKMKGGE